MSHCSFLHTSDSDDPLMMVNQSESIEVCKARIPFIWLAMFSRGDIKALDIDYESEELDDEEQYLVFVTTVNNAIANLNARIDSLKILVPDKYYSHVNNFINCLSKSKRKYIHVAIDDIEQMGSESMVASAETWASVLSDLDKKVTDVRSGLSKYIKGDGVPSGWKALLGSAGMDTGFIFLKLEEINDDNQFYISGGLTDEDISEWDI